MSPISLHLLSCHVPFVGGLFALALLVYAIRRGEENLSRAADYAILAVGLGCAVAWASGPATFSAIETWLDPAATEFAERHEGLGELVMVVWAAAGAIALWGVFLSRASRPAPRWRAPVLLALVSLGLTLAVWAGHEGGRIRHGELRSGVEVSTVEQDGLED